MKKIGIVLGTRPEIIKLSPIIRHCQRKKISFFIIHTNQHYSENMDKIFFDELNLPRPKYNLGIGSETHGVMTGKMMAGIEGVLQKEKPEVILVQGDTNTVMAGALVASKMGIKIGHVESGLRSYDRTMPEEVNRIVTDNVSDFLFCPTGEQAKILRNEGISAKNIHVTGNTIVDSVKEGLKISRKKSNILEALGVESDGYILMTAHRPATVDDKYNLNVVIGAVGKIAERYNKKIVFPIHPRTSKMLDKFRIAIPGQCIIINPVGYLDMLVLQSQSFLIMTDSGGMQEEACILKKRCAVMRENTERPEAVEVGGCVLVGNSSEERMIKSIDSLLRKRICWRNPFGDGKSSERIMKKIFGRNCR